MAHAQCTKDGDCFLDQAPTDRGHLTRAKLVSLFAALLVVSLGVAVMTPRMAPVKPGTAGAFWAATCGVKIAGQDAVWGWGAYPPRDGYFLYYDQRMHQQHLYRVREPDALAHLTQVVSKLRSGDYKMGTARWRSRAYRKWLREDPTRSDGRELVTIMDREHSMLLRRKGPASYRCCLDGRERFDRRWEHVKRYPLNVTFEILYLNALVVFGLWPWLRCLRPWRWSVHVGFLPLLLFLPYLLGYATFTFTSAGPSGGVLYPWLVVWFHPLNTFSCAWDSNLYAILPQPLLYLSQPTGPCISLSGGGPGPTALVLATAVLAVVVFVHVRSVERRKGQRRLQGDGSYDGSSSETATCGRSGGAVTRRKVRLVGAGLALTVALGGTTFFLRSPARRSALVFDAAGDGDLSEVRAIIEALPEAANARSPDGYAPLHLAAARGQRDVVVFLLENAADLRARDANGATVLHHAARSRSVSTVKLLLNAGLAIDAVDDTGETPLHMATGTETIDLLVKHGADVNARGADQGTPLHRVNARETALALLTLGASVAAQDRWGDTPLHKATWRGNADLMRALIDRGAGVNTPSKDGLTPLHLAASRGVKEMVQVLRDHGANADAKDEAGLTPLDYLRANAEAGLRSLLKGGGETEQTLVLPR